MSAFQGPLIADDAENVILHERVHRPLVMVVGGDVFGVFGAQGVENSSALLKMCATTLTRLLGRLSAPGFSTMPVMRSSGDDDQIAAGEIILALVTGDVARARIVLVSGKQVAVKLIVDHVMHLNDVERLTGLRRQCRSRLQERVAHAFWLRLDDDANRHRRDLPCQRPHVLGVAGVAMITTSCKPSA